MMTSGNMPPTPIGDCGKCDAKNVEIPAHIRGVPACHPCMADFRQAMEAKGLDRLCGDYHMWAQFGSMPSGQRIWPF